MKDTTPALLALVRFLRNAINWVILFIYAIGVAFFILPTGLTTGGTTGIAIIMNHHFSHFSVRRNVQRSHTVIGFGLLGKEFALTTMISAFPTILGFFAEARRWLRPWQTTCFFASLFGGLCIGTSLALSILNSASTGGMDIPPPVLNRYFSACFRQPIRIWLYNLDWQKMFSPSAQACTGIVSYCVHGLLRWLLAIGAA